MREIKFRAWSDSSNFMYKFGFQDIYDEGYGDSDNEDEPSKPTVLCPDIHIMQYTGLKDKNGVEIYFGDIVLAPYGRYKYNANEDCDESKILQTVKSVICYPEESKKWFHKEYSPSTLMLVASPIIGEKEFRKAVGKRHYMFPSHFLDSEVIGNIYENPEFLKDSNA